MFGKGRPKISFRRSAYSGVNDNPSKPKANPPAIVTSHSAEKYDSKSSTISKLSKTSKSSIRFRSKGSFNRKSPRNTIIGSFRKITPRNNHGNKVSTPKTSVTDKKLLSPMNEKKLRMLPKIASYRAKGYITDSQERRLYFQLEQHNANPFDTSVLTNIESQLQAFKKQSLENVSKDKNGEKFIEKALTTGKVEKTENTIGNIESNKGSENNIAKTKVGEGRASKNTGKGRSRNIIDELMHLQRIAGRSYSADSTSKGEEVLPKPSTYPDKVDCQREGTEIVKRAKDTVMEKITRNAIETTKLDDKYSKQEDSTIKVMTDPRSLSFGRDKDKETTKERTTKDVAESNMFNKQQDSTMNKNREPFHEVKRQGLKKSYSMDTGISDKTQTKKQHLPYSEIPINDRVIIETKDIFDQGDEDFVENLFVEMCFFARLGFVQPPCCLHCAHQEGIEGRKPNLQCKSLLIWRHDARRLLHPNQLDNNLCLVECQAVRTLLDGEIVQDHYWDRTKKQLIRI